MRRRIGKGASRTLIVGFLALCTSPVCAQEAKTVLGPTNIALQEGANALLARNAEDGIRLTLIGLQQANNASERETARGNLCAGYALQKQYETALAYCDEVLQENDRNWRAYSNRALIYIQLERFEEAAHDLLRGEAISPQSRSLKAVRRMYEDATNPVSPHIIIDDRRGPPAASDAP